MNKIHVTTSIALSSSEIQLGFIRSGGPGGQNVNKVSTAVQLKFDVFMTRSLPWSVRERLIHLAQNKITNEGMIVITGNRFRSQDQNRKDVIGRLVQLIRRAATPPKPRHKTKPSRAAKERRLKAKHHRGEIKKKRRTNFSDDY